jgi:hypothetical protein
LIQQFRSIALAAAGAALTGAVLAGAPPQTPSLAGYPAVGDPPTVTLTRAGRPPLARLRYDVAPDHHDRVALTMSSTMQMGLGTSAVPMEPPTIAITVDLGVSGRDADGSLRYGIAIESATVRGGASGDRGSAAQAAAIQRHAAKLVGLQGSAVVTARGFTTAATFSLDAIGDARVRELLEPLLASVQNLTMALPEEPIGVGARWEVREAVALAGPVLFRRTLCDVTSIDRTAVTLELSMEETAPPQGMRNVPLPRGAAMQLTNLTGKGRGRATIRLDSLVPAADVDSTTTSSMLLSVDGQQQPMTVTTTLRVGISPVRQPKS